MGEISSLAHLFYSCYLALTIIERHTTKNTEMININIQGLHWNPEVSKYQWYLKGLINHWGSILILNLCFGTPPLSHVSTD